MREALKCESERVSESVRLVCVRERVSESRKLRVRGVNFKKNPI